MAVWESDRERRMLGDRVVTLRDEFAAIGAPVATMHDIFCGHHAALVSLLDRRALEEDEDEQARLRRDAAAMRAKLLYGWAYVQVPALAWPRWDAPVDDEVVAALMDRLFPLGPPSAVSRSTQLTLDGLTHLQAGMAREALVSFDEGFSAEVARVRDGLAAAVAEVTVEAKETRDAAEGHAKARQKWDDAYRLLKDTTFGLLKLAGRDQELTRLFTPLPDTAAAGPAQSSSTPTKASDTAGSSTPTSSTPAPASDG